MENKFDKSKFYRALWTVGVPVALQNLITSSLNLVDTMMIGKVGESEIAAVGLANQLFFLFMLVIFGINSGASVLVAQFWGTKDVKSIRKALGVSLTIGIGISLIFVFVALVLPNQFLRLLISDQKVINLGSRYLRIVGLSYVFTAVSSSISITSRSVEQAKDPMIISFISLSLNTFLNWCLIFGNLGFPQMGVEGAAIATLFSRVVEMGLLIAFIHAKKNILACKLKELLSYNRVFLKRVLQIAMPVVVNEFFWALGMVVYAGAIGRLGTEAVASYQIANSTYNFFVVAYMGVASACGVLVGKEIGAGREETAIIVANKFVKLAMLLSVVIGVIIFVSGPYLVLFFDVSSGVMWHASAVLKIFAILGPVKVFTLMMIVGVLRSGGDTKFAMLLEICSVWFVGVPLSLLGAVVLKLPVHMVVLMILLEEVVKSAVALKRFRSNKWINNVVEEIG